MTDEEAIADMMEAIAIARLSEQEAAPTGPSPDRGFTEGGGAAGTFARGIAKGATLNFGDEITGGIGGVVDAVTKGRPYLEGYRDYRDRARAMDEQNAEQHPVADIAGQITGGVGTAVVAAPVSLSARAAARGAPLLSRAIAGGIEGGVVGAGYGAGGGTTTQERVQGALRDGTIGTGTGVAFPVVAAGASNLYQKVANSLAGRTAQRSTGYRPETLRMVADTLDADGTRGPIGRANMQAAGQEAMIADAGPNARGLVDTSIQRGGRGSVEAQRNIGARLNRDSHALTGILDDVLGPPEGVTASTSAIRTGGSATRRTLYDTAYDTAIDYSHPAARRVEDMVRNRVPMRAINEANELMRVRGEGPSRQILARIGDDGSIVYERLPDVRQIDYITRGLRQMAESGDGAGAMGGQTTKGSSYQRLATDIRSNLREAVEPYGAALDNAADDISRIQATRLGADVLSARMTRDALAEELRGMSAAEMRAVLQGARSNLDDTMANVTRTLSDPNVEPREAVKAIKALSSRANRDKMAQLVGDREATRLFDEVDRVARSFDLQAAVATNSRTYGRQAVDRRVAAMSEPGPIGTLADGSPLEAARGVMKAATGRTPADLSRRSDEVYAEISRILTERGSRAQPVFNAIDQIGSADATAAARARMIAEALNGARTSYPSTMLIENKLQ